MPVSNLLEYGDNYSMESGSLTNCYRDRVDDINDNGLDGRTFKYMTKITRKTEARPAHPVNEGNVDQPSKPPVQKLNIVNIPAKFFSNFCRSLNLTLINCEVDLDFSWTKDCILVGHNNNITGIDFEIASTTFDVPVVKLSINDNINLNQGFKRTISWNKYGSEMTPQLKNNNLDYMIDLKLTNINRLFVILLKNGDNGSTRNSFDKYYMPLFEI